LEEENMSSFCIKTNDELFIEYFISNYKDYLPTSEFTVRKKEFRIYTNIFIHYKNQNNKKAKIKIASYISKCIIDIYEKNILEKLYFFNYFYFLDSDKDIIFKNINKILIKSKKKNRFDLIYFKVLDFICDSNKSMILDGFIRFRLRDYIEILEYTIDISVNNYIVEKEYLKFIKLLNEYVSSSIAQETNINLLYLNGNSTLFDENFVLIDNKINIDTDFIKESKIDFTANDYTLNTLLNILPKRITIHIPNNVNDKYSDDEFIKTLKLIFGERISFCSSCDICKFYLKNKYIKI